VTHLARRSAQQGGVLANGQRQHNGNDSSTEHVSPRSDTAQDLDQAGVADSRHIYGIQDTDSGKRRDFSRPSRNSSRRGPGLTDIVGARP
jgi:hypothetical protein